jgi:hypothetical protein
MVRRGHLSVTAALVVVLLALGTLVASPALAQGGGVAANPFQQPGLPQEQATIPSQTTAPLNLNTTSGSSSSSFSSSTGLAIVIGAAIVLFGISFFIWRDARRRAPVRTATAGAAGPRVPGSKRVKPRKLSPAERRRRKRGRAR